MESIDNMLSAFYETAGGLYSFNIYTANMHSLVHTVSFVKLWGPLWVNSMFGFENLNGYLGHTFHGTRKIVSQISFQIQLSQTVPFKLAELSVTESSAAQAYTKKLFGKSRSNMQEIAENYYTIGKIVSHSLTPDESVVISSSGLFISATQTVQKFECLMLSNVSYCGDEYTRSRSRNNTMCIIQLEEGSIQYGCIKSFFLLEHHTIPFCFLEKLHQTRTHP